MHGSPTAKDVAMRCAYYGKASLTEKELKAGYERDKEVFIFAATNNTELFVGRRHNLRKLFEEDMMNGDPTHRYLKNFELMKKKHPGITSYFSHEFVENAAPNKEDARMENLASAVANIERRLNGFVEDFKTARYWMIGGAIAIAVGFYFKQ